MLVATTTEHAEENGAEAPVESNNQEKEDIHSLDVTWEADRARGTHSTSSSANTPAAPTNTQPHHIRPRPQVPPLRMHSSRVRSRRRRHRLHPLADASSRRHRTLSRRDARAQRTPSRGRSRPRRGKASRERERQAAVSKARAVSPLRPPSTLPPRGKSSAALAPA